MDVDSQKSSTVEISLTFTQDIEEVVADQINDGGTPFSWEYLTDTVQETVDFLKTHQPGVSDLLSGDFAGFLEEESAWTAAVDSRNEQISIWRESGTEYFSHGQITFVGVEWNVADWKDLWPKFLEFLNELNQVIDTVGRFSIGGIKVGAEYLQFTNPAKISELFKMLKTYTAQVSDENQRAQIEHFLSLVRDPADMGENESTFLFELMACLPDLDYPSIDAIQGLICEELGQANFIFCDKGFQNLTWLSPEIDDSLYED
jgi:hypothetical protein